MVTAKNPITGDTIATKPATDSFRNNYDTIFRKKAEPCDMGAMCLDCQPRGENGECPHKVKKEVKHDADGRVQWPFPTVNGVRQ